MLRSTHWLECEGEDCGACYPMDHGTSTAREARILARLAGWRKLRVGDRLVDLCRSCLLAKKDERGTP